LDAHGRGDAELVVPSLFVYEVVSVASRVLSLEQAAAFWRRFMSWRISVVEVGATIIGGALVVQGEFGCSFYDAIAPAVARELGAQLCSADVRANGQWPDVMLLPSSTGLGG
jgi:predicted nucleic acid-binding protein